MTTTATPTLEVTLMGVLSRGLASSEKPFVRERGISGKPEIVLPFKTLDRSVHEVRRVLYWFREDAIDSRPPSEKKIEEAEPTLPLVFATPRKTFARQADDSKHVHLSVPVKIREIVEAESRKKGITMSKIVRLHLLAPRPRGEFPPFRAKLASLSVALGAKLYSELKAEAEAANMFFNDYLGRRFVASYTKRRGGSR